MTGLPTSLLIAGAKTVVATMWQVNDAASAILMHHFWEAWQGGDGPIPSPAGALAKARHALRQTTRDIAIAILGRDRGLPDGDMPFVHPAFSDAFQCFGAL